MCHKCHRRTDRVGRRLSSRRAFPFFHRDTRRGFSFECQNEFVSLPPSLGRRIVRGDGLRLGRDRAPRARTSAVQFPHVRRTWYKTAVAVVAHGFAFALAVVLYVACAFGAS